MSEHYKTVTQFEMMNEGNVNFVICHENYKLGKQDRAASVSSSNIALF